MKVKQLVFNRVHDVPNGLHCNVCMATQTLSQWRIADIPIHEGKNTASIVVCSKACMRQFVAHPQVDAYIADLVDRAERSTPPPMTEEEMNRYTELFKDAFGPNVTIIRSEHE